MLQFHDVDAIKEHLKYRQENRAIFETFQPTQEVKSGNFFIRVDAYKKLWYHFVEKNPKNPPVYRFDEIADYEILEDGESIAKGGLGRAVAGGILFGGVGSIVGAATGGKKSKSVIREMKLRISLTNKYNNQILVDLVPPGIAAKQGLVLYNSYKKVENEFKSLLDFMCNQATPISPEASPYVSAADEIKKYKELLDMGAISPEEYEAKKKQLLAQ